MRLRFGAFLAPHHPPGEHPTLQMRRDLDFAVHLDHLGYDEFWVGEHHSGGWETICSPELFLAAAGERTERIMLGTGVVSLPYHQPFHVAQRIVLLDHLTRGRAILGTGPGALPSDALALGVDPALIRERQDEALSVILPLLRGERVTYHCDWFQLNDAALHLLPLQEKLPVTVASSISPSGMSLAGKYGLGVLSIASNSVEGLQALPTQWGFAETYAKEHHQTVDRREWRVLMSFHLAESREQAVAEAAEGLKHWHNEYNVGVLGRPGANPIDAGRHLAEAMNRSGAGVIGTPDDAVAAITRLQETSGGFGVVLGFAHDWANPEHTLKSWDLFARYVVPAVNGYTAPIETSRDYVAERKGELMEGAANAVLAAIRKHNAKYPRQDRPEPQPAS